LWVCGVRWSNSGRLILLIPLLLGCLFYLNALLPRAEAQSAQLRVMFWEWSPEVDEAIDDALREYEDLRDISIDLIRIPQNEPYWDNLLELMAIREAPDVLWVHYDMVPELYKREYIFVLDKMVEVQPGVLLGLAPEVIDSFRYRGILFCIPVGADAPFSLNGYAISNRSAMAYNEVMAFDLIMFLRARIPPLPKQVQPLPEPVKPQPLPPIEPVTPEPLPPVEPVKPLPEPMPIEPSAPLPDLSINEINSEVFADNKVLLITAYVGNFGQAETPETTLYAVCQTANWWCYEVPVHPLNVGESDLVSIKMEIPANMHGSYRFDIRVDPWDSIEEVKEINNWQGIDLWRPSYEPVSVKPGILFPAIGAAAVLLAGIGLSIRHYVKLNHHKEWLGNAEEDEPPEVCQPCTRYCRKIELKFDPALRKLTYLVLRSYEKDNDMKKSEKRIIGEPVDDINELMAFNRKGKKPGDLQEKVAVLAEPLRYSATELLQGKHGPLNIEFIVHLEGGKATCQFTLYHCRRRGNASFWEEEDKWKMTVQDKCDRSLGALRVLEAGKNKASEGFTGEVTQLLMRFITDL